MSLQKHISSLLLIVPNLLFAQIEDSTRHLRVQEILPIRVPQLNQIVIRTQRPPNVLYADQIKLLGTNDAGDLAARLAGSNMKTYGGLGGLKTISIRSLGASHNSVVVDGFVQGNQQTGQVNLGSIPTDNIIGVGLTLGGTGGIWFPVSSSVSGSLLSFRTFENTHENDSLMIRTSASYGSFDQKNSYLALKVNRPNYFASVYGKYRNAVGNYRYHIQNGNTEIDAKRKNNDYEDYYFGGTVGFRKNAWTGRLGYKGMGIDQGLPGAVVFYSATEDERLETQGHRVFSDLTTQFEGHYFRLYSSANLDQIRYLDPTYFNTTGSVDVTYNNRDLRSGISWNKQFRSQNFFAGAEHAIATLTTDDSTFAQPIRNHFYGIAGWTTHFGAFYTSVSLSSQFVDEENRNGAAAPNQVRVNPFASIIWHRNNYRHSLWYRNSVRVPTFNELYYNNIGNTNLLPEFAHQLSYGVQHWRYFKRFEVDIAANAYFNSVQNKIVAIPSKNLFIWSMQNVENAHVYGADVQLYIKRDIVRIVIPMTIDLSLNYTFQKVIDRTEGSLTYGSQLAYCPEHLANFDLTFKRLNSGFSFSTNYTSMRYSLNENIPSNEVDGFFLLDLSAFHTFKLPKKQELRLQVNVKNVLNESYAYIRSFVMPGTNYLISLHYAFH